MQQLLRILHFTSWPIICGVLVALVYIQYQQLSEFSRQTADISKTQEPRSNTASFADAISKAAPSVVSINATSVNVESVERAAEDRVNLYLGERASLGSGVIVSEQGFILTNLHVVDTLFDAFDTEVTVSDGRRTPATVIAWDKANDLAVLHINMDDLAPIAIGDDKQLEVGDIVFAIGYPRNIGQSVSQGIVSALTHNPNSSISIIQTDAAINPGNSGGALIDTNGKLVGLNSSIFSESGNFEGIGFATPASTAVSAMEELVKQAIAANSGYLGVLTGEALNERSSQLFFGVNHIRGMLVENVDTGGAAERAGIQPGDVITRVEETPVIDGQNIMMEIRNKKPGDTITVQVYRNGQTFNLPVTLGFGEALIIET
ncbi:MAG: 2-alkenal reductase [Gammaproteobacteria bacterium]|nr:2-alkenal reductase [Gammaproteobacteria bacterium]MEC8994459.1 trypsin-like peptidase domain-containing protein [Pseudomonadota bacterium]MBC59251.1 2-alkenal reductase [Gammaproteobacteria bacterium]MBI90798.1 2-alkenal reductase [Gammaproteobacteria bacterium]MEC9218539.1 trypsin-like peptidase domain-containing protein [Pseudomonadota bacterium]|tara:strand:+ start:1348 stop:2472 length:1125 start_codon:yes stop_codon:yes gene_type:complete